MAALEEFQDGAGDAPGHPLLGRGQGDAVVAAGGDQHGASDLGQALPRIMRGAGFELPVRAHGVAGLPRERVLGRKRNEVGVGLWMALRPGFVATDVGDRDQVAGPGLALQMLDLVEGE